MDWKHAYEELLKENNRLKEENARLRQRLGLVPELPSHSQSTSNVFVADQRKPLSMHAKSSPADKIKLFRSYFRGRENVFTRRWYSEKSGKSGYSPVCENEWKFGLCDKGYIKCGDCPNRQLAPLTDQILYAHLSGRDPLGRVVVGLYPVTASETCYLIALDFDDERWWEELQSVAAVCRNQSVPATGTLSFRAGRASLAVL